MKNKKDFSSIKKLIIYSKPYIIPLIFCVIFAIISAVCTIIGPSKINDLMTIITDGIIKGIDLDKFKTSAILIIVIYVIGVLSNYLMDVIAGIVSAKLSKSLRSDINEKLTHLPLSFYDSSLRGDVMSVVTNDVDTISQTLSQSIAYILQALILFFGIIIMMFVTNYVLAFVTIGVSILGFIAIIFIGSKSRAHFDNRQQLLGSLNARVEEVFSNQYLVREYNAENEEIETYENINSSLFKANQKSQWLSNMMMPIMNLVSNLAYALIYLVGVAMSIKDGYVEPTVLATIVTFTLYARLFSQPLQTFSQAITYIQQSGAASKRVFRYLEEEIEEDESNKESLIKNSRGKVEFRHINFSYNKDKEIIKDFSLLVKPGSKIAIVGPTGAGKTTIVNLLMRFYNINSGEIYIDDININDTKRENVRNQFDMILQDTWLFEGSIRDNLRYNNPHISDDEILNALSLVGLTKYISSLPCGLDTIINSKLSLSEGQKQELTIARAMLKDSPMLILDEATSNVDTRSEIVIQKAMDNLMKGRTSFVIAHRLSTIKNADLILVLNEGEIVEMGKHKELLEKNGFYAKLYNAQFDLENSETIEMD